MLTKMMNTQEFKRNENVSKRFAIKRTSEQVYCLSTANIFKDRRDFRDVVRKRLVTLYQSDSPKALIRILYFLDKKELDYQDGDGPGLSPYWRSLEALNRTGCDRAFKQFVKRLENDTETAEKDPRFEKVMDVIYENWMVHSETPLPSGHEQGFDLDRLEDFTLVRTFALAGLAQALEIFPQETQAKILPFVCLVTKKDQSPFPSMDDYVDLVNKAGGTVSVYWLAASHLGSKVKKNFGRLRNGEISVRRLIKNTVDVAVTTAAGVWGGNRGVDLGLSFEDPFSTVVGGTIGGSSAAIAASFVVDRFTQWLFDLPRSETLEMAYRYLGVGYRAPNAEVNIAARELILKHHPDKGGTEKQFGILRKNLAAIKEARGSHACRQSA